jgi:hypothetical protein
MDWFQTLTNVIDIAIRSVDPYIGLIALVPIALTFLEVKFGRRWRHRKWFRQIIKAPGNRPAILIVDLLPDKEIVAHVENYRRMNDDLKDIPADRIFRIDAAGVGISAPELKADDVTAFAEEMRSVVADMYMAGPDVVHYFHSGPIPTAAMVAASLANSFRVQIYHWRQGQYECWGPIRHLETF